MARAEWVWAVGWIADVEYSTVLGLQGSGGRIGRLARLGFGQRTLALAARPLLAGVETGLETLDGL